MAVTQAVVSVGTTAVQVSTDRPVRRSTDKFGAQSISVQNLSTTADVYLGTSAVTSSAYGFFLPRRASSTSIPASVSIDLYPGESLWAVASAAATSVAVLQRGL